MTAALRHHHTQADARARNGQYAAPYAPGYADKRAELILALKMAQAPQPKEKPQYRYNKATGTSQGTQCIVLTAITRPMMLSEICEASGFSTTATRSALRKAHAAGRVTRANDKRPFVWKITRKGRAYVARKEAAQ